jgi:light-regulated signal transduction histidine kinase (bacteriophytochrome)
VIARKKIEKVVAERTSELAEANSSLQKSNAELAQFAYIASHDLQEPVRKVSTFIQMLESNLADIDELSLSYLTKIKKSSARMLSLIRDVLAYSQLSTQTEMKTSVDLENIIKDIRFDLELLIEQKNATINLNQLPVIEGIPLQISQLFANLISNALKFSSRERDCVIDIICSDFTSGESYDDFKPDPGKRYFLIRVSDNGIGFEQEYAEQIFSIFQRLHGKQQYEGTGIGLALCRKIVQNHGGHIFASSTRGIGTTFHIVLPEKQDHILS